jgi:hypothetical protein
LVVPVFDSKSLLEHASKKTKEVLAAALPYTKDDFQVHVADARDFAQQIAIRESAGSVQLLPHVEAEDVAMWEVDNNNLLRELQRKTANLPMETRTVPMLIKKYLEGQQLISDLEQKYFPLYRQFVRLKATEEENLALAALSSPKDTGTLIAGTRDLYCGRLAATLPKLAPSDVDTLGWEAVADWLMRCPLEP